MTFTLSVKPLETPLNGITLYEKIDFDTISALQSSNVMIPYDTWEYNNGFSHERDHLAKYMTTYKKKLGLFAVEYTRGRRTIGRPHVKGNLGMWCVARQSRNTLMRHTYYDIDIKNCHPEIIRGLLNISKIDVSKRFPYLDEYCNKRGEKIAETMALFKCDEKTAKNAFIRIMYNGGIESWKAKNKLINDDPSKEHFYDGFKDDVSRIIDKFVDQNQDLYAKHCDTYRKEPKNRGKKNERGSFLSNAIQDYETKIISHCCSYLMSNTNITKEGDIHILTFAADGFMVLKDRVDALDGGLDTFLENITQLSFDLAGFELEFIAKDINDPREYHTGFVYEPQIVIEDVSTADVKAQEKLQKQKDKQEASNVKAKEKLQNEERAKKDKVAGETTATEDYKSALKKMKKDFELEHFKVIEISCFVQEVFDETYNRKLIQRNPSELKVAFSHLRLKYKAWENDKQVDKSVPFVPAWMECEDIRKYDRMDCFPDNSKCPINCFNIWNPFEMERYYAIPLQSVDVIAEKYEVRMGVNTLRGHLGIMCNHEEATLNEFETWIAQMIQFPDTKTHMPIFQSEEGAGKGSFVQLMTKILGQSKVLLTANPEEYVWGRFNNLMETTFLVFFDEISKQITTNGIDKIKNLITEPKIQIQHKGKGSYSMTSFHRFGGLTNAWDGGMTMSKGARRFLMCAMSNEKKGDMNYWKRFYNLLEDQEVLLGFYHHYKYMKVERVLPPPKITEFSKQLQQLSIDVPTLWLTDMIRDARINQTALINAEPQKYKRILGRYVVELYGNEAFKMLIEWCDTTGNKKYETTPQKLGIYLTLKKLDGLTKGRHTENGDTKYYDVEKLYTELTK